MVDTSFLDEMHKKSPNINVKLQLLKDFLIDSWKYRNIPIRNEFKDGGTSLSTILSPPNIVRKRGPFEAAKFGKLIKLNSIRKFKKVFDEEEILKEKEISEASSVKNIKTNNNNIILIDDDQRYSLKKSESSTFINKEEMKSESKAQISLSKNKEIIVKSNDISESYKSEESIGLFSISNNSSFIMHMDNMYPLSHESMTCSIDDFFTENDNSSMIKIS